jgi:hypothetical protein
LSKALREIDRLINTALMMALVSNTNRGLVAMEHFFEFRSR